MSYYIQYHNADVEGLPEEKNGRSKYNCRIRTKKAFVKSASGTVFLIVGIGRPKRYYLWNCFKIEKVRTPKKTATQVMSLWGEVGD